MKIVAYQKTAFYKGMYILTVVFFKIRILITFTGLQNNTPWHQTNVIIIMMTG